MDLLKPHWDGENTVYHDKIARIISINKYILFIN